MKNAKVLGTGRYLPEKKVTNFDLEKIVETSDEWIYTRTGIKERRIAEQETCHEMATSAAKSALKDAQVNVEDVDLIVVATTTSEYMFPSVACLIQKAIGATNAMAFDITAACSGFIFAMDIATKYIQSGMAQHVIVVGSEKLSQITDWEDRNSCVLFGDGAGAVVLGATDEKGILAAVCRSVGSDFECLTGGNRYDKTPFYEPVTVPPHINMDGRAVFEFACTTVPKCIQEVLDLADLTREDIDYYILHQANTRIISTVAKKLGQDISKFYTNMEFYGNTSAASVAIALDEMKQSGKLIGKKVVLAGFGAGLTYGANIIQF